MKKAKTLILSDGVIADIFKTAKVAGHHFQTMAQELGVNRTQGAIVMYLHHENGGVTATKLRRVIGVTGASMSNTLADLEREGLINRTPNPKDARSMLVYLTKRGEALVTRAPEMMTKMEQQAIAGLDDDEIGMARRVLEKIRANLGHDEDSDWHSHPIIKEK